MGEQKVESYEIGGAGRNGSRPAVLEGILGVLALYDVIQFAALSLRNACLEVENDLGRRGQIWMDDGQVLDARLDPLQGEEALLQMLLWRQGRFRVRPLGSERHVRRTIDRSLQALLLQAACEEDEQRRSGDAALGPAESEPPDMEFEKIFQQATIAYVQQNHWQALQLFRRCLDLRPQDPRVLYNIEKIRTQDDRS
jgi:uncharacterized protein DUF4388